MMDTSIQPFFVVPADASLDANAELLGSKAAQLARMSRLGLLVPPAFVMPTSLCNGVNQKGWRSAAGTKKRPAPWHRPARGGDEPSLRR